MATVSTKTIAQAIYEASHGKEGKDLSVVLENTTKILAAKHLLSKAPEILSELQDIIDKKEGIVRAHVESSHKLSKAIHDEIEDELKKRYKAKEVHLEVTENPKLLGGMKIQVRDEIIDLTLATKINQLQHYLIEH